MRRCRDRGRARARLAAAAARRPRTWPAAPSPPTPVTPSRPRRRTASRRVMMPSARSSATSSARYFWISVIATPRRLRSTPARDRLTVVMVPEAVRLLPARGSEPHDPHGEYGAKGGRKPRSDVRARTRAAARAHRRCCAARRSIDERWENQPAHFWIVLVDRGVLPRARDRDQRGGAPPPRRAAAADRARVRRQRRASSACTRSRRRASRSSGRNAGFVLATPVGLVARRRARGGVGGRVPARDVALDRAPRAPAARARARGDRGWAVVSLAELPPLQRRVTPEDVEAPLAAVGAVGVAAYAYAAFAYFRIYARRRHAGSRSRSPSPSRCSPRRSSSPCSRWRRAGS